MRSSTAGSCACRRSRSRTRTRSPAAANHAFHRSLSPSNGSRANASGCAPASLRAALSTLPDATQKIVVLQGCYSGAFLAGPDALTSLPNTTVLTAAASNRPSFGCGAGTRETFWGGALGRTLEDHVRRGGKGLEWHARDLMRAARPYVRCLGDHDEITAKICAGYFTPFDQAFQAFKAVHAAEVDGARHVAALEPLGQRRHRRAGRERREELGVEPGLRQPGHRRLDRLAGLAGAGGRVADQQRDAGLGHGLRSLHVAAAVGAVRAELAERPGEPDPLAPPGFHPPRTGNSRARPCPPRAQI